MGSSKTTLLSRLLQHRDGGGRVIINEFGEIGLDHLLVATPGENTVLLSSVCICCTVRGDLVDTLRDLFCRRRDGDIPAFDRVVIETTGLADPVPIIQTVVTDEQLAPCFRLDSVVTLVDGVNGASQLDQQAESVKQAAVADRLLMRAILAPAVIDALRHALRDQPRCRTSRYARGIAPSCSGCAERRRGGRRRGALAGDAALRTGPMHDHAHRRMT